LADVPENVKSALEIIPISNADEVLKHALTGPLTPIEWTDEEDIPAAIPPATDGEIDPVMTH
jgi:ATP-dependent Lon protease